jgi:alpha-tubulin suppressor-like RCC1 family protein
VTAVAAGNGISAALTRSGDLYLWGRNSFDQLGLGATRDPGGSAVSQTRPAKARLPRGADAIAVDAGNRHVAVALRDGRLVIFGLDAAGQPTEGTIRLKSAWGRPVKLAAGEDFTLILTSRNVLLALGANASGQLGVGDYHNRLQPAAVRLPQGSGHVRDFIACARGGAALTSTGDVYSWGDGNVGQHGAGSGDKELATRPTPTRVKALAGARITGLHGGHHHAFVTVTSGPAVALRILPVRKTVAPGVAVNYRVHKSDVFGNDLGAAGRYTLTVTDGRVAGSTVIARTLGVHHVTARSGRLVGRAILTVTKGPRP